MKKNGVAFCVHQTFICSYLVAMVLFVVFALSEQATAGNNAGAAFSVWPDTGQTKCYDIYHEIACPPEGEDYYGQDAQYQGPEISHTKLGYVDGKLVELPDNATRADGWIMTRDNVTGLIWEMKTAGDNETNYDDLHDADNLYKWCDTNPGTNGGIEGNCTVENNTKNFIDALNEEYFGGFSDWRLPTIKELSSFFGGYSPTSFETGYWSSTSFAGNATSAWACSYNLEYGPGGPYIYPVYKEMDGIAVAVRGDSVVAPDQFIDNHDGTVTDIRTGLMWQKCSMGQTYDVETGFCDGTPQEYTWPEALSACEDLTLASYTDWRLPNINELQSIYDYAKSDLYILFFPLPDFQNWYQSVYFSSTTNPYFPNRSLVVWFMDGEVGSSPLIKGDDAYYVRAVRAGFLGKFNDLTIFLKGMGGVYGAWVVKGYEDSKDCYSNTCMWPFPQDTEVSLNATGTFNSVFSHWDNGCVNCGSDTQCTITVSDNLSCTAVFVERGDVSEDGTLNIVDALFIARYAVNLPVDDFNEDAADVDCNGHVDIVDALFVARKAVGLTVQGWCTPPPL